MSLEIEDREEVEVGKWAKHKKSFYSEYNIILSLGGLKKKKWDMNSLIYFSFPAVTLKLQSSNFK
jgi:hypothetical protein